MNISLQNIRNSLHRAGSSTNNDDKMNRSNNSTLNLSPRRRRRREREIESNEKAKGFIYEGIYNILPNINQFFFVLTITFSIISICNSYWSIDDLNNTRYGLQDMFINNQKLSYANDYEEINNDKLISIMETTFVLMLISIILISITFLLTTSLYNGQQGSNLVGQFEPIIHYYGSLISSIFFLITLLYYTFNMDHSSGTIDYGSSYYMLIVCIIFSFISFLIKQFQVLQLDQKFMIQLEQIERIYNGLCLNIIYLIVLLITISSLNWCEYNKSYHLGLLTAYQQGYYKDINNIIDPPYKSIGTISLITFIFMLNAIVTLLLSIYYSLHKVLYKAIHDEYQYYNVRYYLYNSISVLSLLISMCLYGILFHPTNEVKFWSLSTDFIWTSCILSCMCCSLFYDFYDEFMMSSEQEQEEEEAQQQDGSKGEEEEQQYHGTQYTKRIQYRVYNALLLTFILQLISISCDLWSSYESTINSQQSYDIGLLLFKANDDPLRYNVADIPSEYITNGYHSLYLANIITTISYSICFITLFLNICFSYQIYQRDTSYEATEMDQLIHILYSICLIICAVSSFISCIAYASLTPLFLNISLQQHYQISFILCCIVCAFIIICAIIAFNAMGDLNLNHLHLGTHPYTSLSFFNLISFSFIISSLSTKQWLKTQMIQLGLRDGIYNDQNLTFQDFYLINDQLAMYSMLVEALLICSLISLSVAFVVYLIRLLDWYVKLLSRYINLIRHLSITLPAILLLLAVLCYTYAIPKQLHFPFNQDDVRMYTFQYGYSYYLTLSAACLSLVSFLLNLFGATHEDYKFHTGNEANFNTQDDHDHQQDSDNDSSQDNSSISLSLS